MRAAARWAATAAGCAGMFAAVAGCLLLNPGACRGDDCVDVGKPVVTGHGPSSAPPPDGPSAVVPSGDATAPADGVTTEPSADDGTGPQIAGDVGWEVRGTGPVQNSSGQGAGTRIQGGPLSVTSLSGSRSGVGKLTSDGVTGTLQGSLEPLLVQDFRGTRNGWSLTARMSDFTGPGGRTIPASRLSWEPTCTPHQGGGPYPSDPETGPPVSGAHTALLCSAAASTGVTGGEFDVGAKLRLRLPDGRAPSGSYTATLVLTLA